VRELAIALLAPVIESLTTEFVHAVLARFGHKVTPAHPCRRCGHRIGVHSHETPHLCTEAAGLVPCTCVGFHA